MTRKSRVNPLTMIDFRLSSIKTIIVTKDVDIDKSPRSLKQLFSMSILISTPTVS
jgi:hypothetical protein